MTHAKNDARTPFNLIYLASIVAALLLSSCTIHTSGSARSSADANSRSDASARAESKAGAKAEGSASAKGSAKSNGSAKGSASGSSSSKVVFKSKKRVSGMGKAKKADHFEASFLVRGGKSKGKASGKGKSSAKWSASGKASGKASVGGSSSGKANVNAGGKGKGKPDKTPTDQDSDKGKGKPNKGKASGKGKGKPDKGKASGKGKGKPNKGKASGKGKGKPDKGKDKPDEADVEEPEVIDPPDEPPENDFGYEDPVRGCFEGVVYPLAKNAPKLPTAWDDLEAISVVYACEWDIPTRRWSKGFPGVENHFEWFAIQYTGAFHVENAGKWKFRISSDDGTKLYIDGKLVLDNDGQHPPRSKEVEVDLSAGDHDMVLEYFQGPRYHINLQVYATPPGGEEGIFSVR